MPPLAPTATSPSLEMPADAAGPNNAWYIYHSARHAAALDAEAVRSGVAAAEGDGDFLVRELGLSPEQRLLESGGRPGAVRPLRGDDEGPIALVATAQAAAARQRGGASGGEEAAMTLAITPDDLRVRQRESPVGRCILFLVDASGSMAAQRRMALAKGAVQHLLRDAYQRRERVGLIAFRGAEATLILPPTNSVELADARLREVPTGGRTLLAHGLQLAAEVLRQPGQRGVPALVVLLSDGRTNVALNGGEPLADAHAAARHLREMGGRLWCWTRRAVRCAWVWHDAWRMNLGRSIGHSVRWTRWGRRGWYARSPKGAEAP